MSPDVSGPLRIVHYLPEMTLAAGGVVRAAIDLCGALTGAGHAVTLLTFDDSDVPPHWKQGRQHTPRLMRLGGAVPRGRGMDRATLEQMRPHLEVADVVHLHTPWEISNLPLARWLRRQRIPYVVTIHGMLDDWCMAQKTLKKRLFLLLFGRRFLAGASAVHFTAEMEKQQSLKWMREAACATHVAPLVFDLAQFENLPASEQAEQHVASMGVVRPYVLFLSRIHPKKGIEVLLEAMRLESERGHRWQLVVAGPGEERYVGQLLDLAAEFELSDRVKFVGMVQGADKIALYRGADVFALPTFQENFGFVLVEAMACEVPVVTTRGTDIWGELQRGGARIVDRTPQAFADAIRQLLDDASLRNSLARQGKEFVQHWLPTQKVVADYEAIYRAALSSSKGMPS